MNEPKPWPATPGSDAAVALGCKCPRMDNSYGRGRGDGSFVVNGSCPVHNEIPVNPKSEGVS